jgi:N-methylhydantoinase A
VHLGRWVEAPVYDLDALAAGQAVPGPAVVETATTTVLLRPRDRAVVTPLGWLDVTVT